MSEGETKPCPFPAAHRYTWPGNDEAFICFVHASQLHRIAQAVGSYQQFIPLALGLEEKCHQQIAKDADEIQPLQVIEAG